MLNFNKIILTDN